MLTEAKKYKVCILGETYSLVSDESEDLVNKSVNFINELVSEIKEKSSGVADNKIVAFALIKTALRMSTINTELEAYKYKTKELEDMLNQSDLLD
ncbi:hypothetical protein A3F66_06405 [candidate division TM6 bacterium RIFCSPHIGHO2_12_FULL_32_22]|nr:MAG: hypothetical protein A3F66_06405 [candidate division TM6 bacterium RIFCSPHIGHO2_12_FULL_32_22]